MTAFESSLACRVLIDAPAAGAWNMAVDEVLLETAASGGPASLRFYQWSEPTLSLGYFQRHAQRQSHRASRDCQMVRRQTGGGAILHDAELTYSLAIGTPNRAPTQAARLYDVAHQALADVLGSLGVDAQMCEGDETSDEEPFLCFQRRARGDLVFGRAKVCGSAQRRSRGAILQHGSLLLAASPQAPELPGLAELTGKPWEAGLILRPWQRELASRLRLELAEGGLSAAELDAVRTLVIEKYDTTRWNRRR